MKIEKGKYYFLKIKIYGRELDYKCKIIDISKNKIKLVNNEGDRLNFNTSDIIHVQEIDKSEVEPNANFIKINKKF